MTTQGRLSFHDWLADDWGVLFSHPKDFTPCAPPSWATVAALDDEFTARGCKVIGLPVDSVGDHHAWLPDIEQATGHVVTYPLIEDPDLVIAKLYGMLPTAAAGPATGRTAGDNAAARSLFVIVPDKAIKASLTYPITSGRDFHEVLRLDSLQLTAGRQLATPANWQAGDRVIVVPSVSDEVAASRFGVDIDRVLPYLRLVDHPATA